MKAWAGSEPRVLVLFSCSLSPFAVSSSVWLIALTPSNVDSHRNVMDVHFGRVDFLFSHGISRDCSLISGFKSEQGLGGQGGLKC